MIISSNRDSLCRQCKKEWKVGQQIHYDPDTRAMCIDESCFDSQEKELKKEMNTIIYSQQMIPRQQVNSG